MKDNAKQRKRLVVVGGGAAGIFCAINAARLNPQLEVIVFEKSNKLLSKVKISGGGRCNVTHSCNDIREMSRCYPRGEHFVRKAFHHFFVQDCIDWFEERGVTLKTESDGRIFPITDDSATIIRCLLQDASRFNVDLRLSNPVTQIKPLADGFQVGFYSADSIRADYVCLACGGYSKREQFSWLEELGHSIEEPVPSLFSFNLPNHPIGQLQGISFDEVQVTIPQSKIQTLGAAIITHWGVSGPAVLKASAWGARLLADRNWYFSASINWLPQYNQQSLSEFLRHQKLEDGKKTLRSKNPLGLPSRFWEFALSQSGVREGINWADLNAKELNSLAVFLCNSSLEVKGKTTFKDEFVTAGGIRLSEVDPQTMQSRKHPRLFFVGEMLDVDGITGGYNFQHAWTSGMLAARAVSHYPHS